MSPWEVIVPVVTIAMKIVFIIRDEDCAPYL